MRKGILLFFLIAGTVLVLTGCSTKVRFDFDENADFMTNKSFAFVPMDEKDMQSLDGQRVEEAIAKEMTAKGFTKVAPEQAGLMVGYDVIEGSTYESDGTTIAVGARRRYVGATAHTGVSFREYRYGRLVLEISDAGSERVIWRAVSRREIDEYMKREKRISVIQEEIAEMLSGYPPELKTE